MWTLYVITCLGFIYSSRKEIKEYGNLNIFDREPNFRRWVVLLAGMVTIGGFIGLCIAYLP